VSHAIEEKNCDLKVIEARRRRKREATTLNRQTVLTSGEIKTKFFDLALVAALIKLLFVHVLMTSDSIRPFTLFTVALNRRQSAGHRRRSTAENSRQTCRNFQSKSTKSDRKRSKSL
jgi:hypothetical protein